MVPKMIEVNPTELCNRKCSFCARSEDYPNQDLNFDLRNGYILKKRLQEMNWSGSLRLIGQGEPTLNKKLVRIAKLLKYDNIPSGQYPNLNDLGIKGKTINSILPQYIYRFRTYGQFG